MTLHLVKGFLSKPIPSTPSRYDLQAMKNLEWIFIGIRFLSVPMGLLMVRMHHPVSSVAVLMLLVLYFAVNGLACLLNWRIRKPEIQFRMSFIMLVFDMILVCAAIFMFLNGEHTAVYAYFAIVVIEAAVRFGFVGSMVMGVIFAGVMYGAMDYRETEYEIPFSLDGYLYWTLFMMILALTIGLIVRGAQSERRMREQLIKEKVLITERHRIARDLHDTVLKTLQGISLEAYALQRQALPQSVKDKMRYIDSVCRRSSNQMRDAISELRRDDGDQDIVYQLSQLVQGWSLETGISVSFENGGEIEWHPSLSTGYNLRSTLSEALENIWKHASASQVRVSVEIDESQFLMLVQDDGCGIGEEIGNMYGFAAMGKFGIIGMRECIEQIGGQFHIESKDAGTCLTVKIPL